MSPSSVGIVSALAGVAVGLALGVSLGLRLAGGPDAEEAATGRTGAGTPMARASVETDARGTGAPPSRDTLETEIAWLRAALEAQRSPADAAGPAPGDGAAGAAEAAEEAPVAFDAEALREAGYAEAEIERLRERWDAFELERLYLRDRARREGWLRSGRFRRENRQLRSDLRAALGDEDYDAMLYAAGQHNRVDVFGVLPGSAADEVGLQPGDRILRYDGERIFDMRSLVRATAETEAGRTVEVRYERDGSERRAFLPAGPIGVRLRPGRGSPDTLR